MMKVLDLSGCHVAICRSHIDGDTNFFSYQSYPLSCYCLSSMSTGVLRASGTSLGFSLILCGTKEKASDLELDHGMPDGELFELHISPDTRHTRDKSVRTRDWHQVMSRGTE